MRTQDDRPFGQALDRALNFGELTTSPGISSSSTSDHSAGSIEICGMNGMNGMENHGALSANGPAGGGGPPPRRATPGSFGCWASTARRSSKAASPSKKPCREALNSPSGSRRDARDLRAEHAHVHPVAPCESLVNHDLPRQRHRTRQQQPDAEDHSGRRPRRRHKRSFYREMHLRAWRRNETTSSHRARTITHTFTRWRVFVSEAAS